MEGFLGGTSTSLWEGDDDDDSDLDLDSCQGNQGPQSDIDHHEVLENKVGQIQIPPYTYTQSQPRKNLLELSGVLRPLNHNQTPLSQTHHTPGAGHPISRISVTKHKIYGMNYMQCFPCLKIPNFPCNFHKSLTLQLVTFYVEYSGAELSPLKKPNRGHGQGHEREGRDVLLSQSLSMSSMRSLSIDNVSASSSLSLTKHAPAPNEANRASKAPVASTAFIDKSKGGIGILDGLVTLVPPSKNNKGRVRGGLPGGGAKSQQAMRPSLNPTMRIPPSSIVSLKKEFFG